MFFPGGAERIAIDIAKHGDKKYFEVSVAAIEKSLVKNTQLQDELDKNDIRHRVLTNKPKGWGKYFYKIYQIYKVFRFLKDEKPDIVHTHLFTADVFGRISAKLAGIKVIVSTEHNINNDEACIKKFLKYFTSFLCDKIYAVSNGVRNYAIKSEHIFDSKIDVIYNGIDLEKFSFEEKNYSPKKKVVIGAMGKLSHQKGFDFLIEALSLIRDCDFECRIAGEDAPSGSVKKDLEKLIKEKKLEDKVKLFGYEKDAKVFFGNLDIFILPSRWEGLPLVLLEAGLSGLPVIASNIGGVDEVINDGVNGLLVAFGDKENLSRQIKILVNDSSKRQELGKSLRQSVISKFDLKKMQENYFDKYTTLFNNKFNEIQDIVLAVTYQCNSRCRMCSIWKKNEEPGLALSDIDNLPKTLKNLNISGGEPFLRSDLFDLIKRVKKIIPDTKIIISTNGFATDLILNQMSRIVSIDSGIGVAVSIDGVDKAHDDIRGVIGGYDRAVETIKRLKKLGIKNLKIGFTVGDYNFSELKKVYNLSRELGVEFSLSLVHSSDNFFNQDNKIKNKQDIIQSLEWLIKKELRTWNLKKWLRAYYAYGMQEFVKTGKRILPDYSGKFSLFIDPSGDMYPSDISSQKLGNIKTFDVRRADFATSESWMICTARQAIKMHKLKVVFWILKNKIFLI